jgi:hypothetical protein
MDKQYILDEIKRTAETNSGVPLGKQRFFQVTGIGPRDWEGKIWARWGDAIREAGLVPNELQQAYDEQFLLDKFIALMREIGRFPVNTELLLKARNDPSFPSNNTFKRFGSKQQFAARIQSYCQDRPEFEDVLALCAAVVEHPGTATNGKAEHVETFGFVYLIKSGRYYKIGRSNAVGRRERELTIQLPDRATTVHTIRTDDPVGIEAYWHRRFHSKRKNGEWFELSGPDIMAFKRRTFM